MKKIAVLILLAELAMGGASLAQQPPRLGLPALEPAGTGGIALVDRALAKLTTHRRLLVVGAHPDDEDNWLLTLVSREMGGEAAYLSLSRGEGGQNLIGNELGPGLGVVRTGELLGARRIEGTRQYFTRAFDFGYTRSLDETFTRWPREEMLEDAVRVVRRFKPQVIVAIFPSDGRAGHGQHRASAVIADDVFQAAGDGERFPELLEEGLTPWQPEAMYRRTWWDSEATTLETDLGGIEGITGRSINQIAASSRSMHRSQDMGRERPIGPRTSGLGWVAGGAGPESSRLFAGIDTRLGAIGALIPGDAGPQVVVKLEEVGKIAAAVRSNLSPTRLERVVPQLRRIVSLLAEAVESAAGESNGTSPARSLLNEKRIVAEAALAAAAGVAVDALADRETLSPDGQLLVTAEIWNAGNQSVKLTEARIVSATGWEVDAQDPGPTLLAPQELHSREFPVRLAAGTGATIPYFLREPMRGDLYDWQQVTASVRGEPLQQPPLTVMFSLEIDGTPVTLTREVVYRFGDQAFGEVRRPVRAVPLLEIEARPSLILLRQGDEQGPTWEVTLRSHAATPVAGRLELRLNGIDTVETMPFTIADPEGRLVLQLPAPRLDESTRGSIVAVIDGGGSFGISYPVYEHPHIRPMTGRVPTEIQVQVLDLDTTGIGRVGYVRGASDRIPETLAEVGIPVTLLGKPELLDGDLANYDVVVIGPRAYETEPELMRAANGRLLDYARSGGRLVVQYQQYQFVKGEFTPYSLTIARPHDRVTDETAGVRLLDPEHPFLTVPNQIGDRDWDGWVQERGLYFAHEWDEAFQPLLAMQDPEQEEQSGALLTASVGEGTYIYTGLAFFRQIPAGVPGALRLFSNLLAVPTKKGAS